MRKIAIVTDSNSGITQDEGRKLGISVLPMPFYINDVMYLEGITLSQEDFYERLKMMNPYLLHSRVRLKYVVYGIICWKSMMRLYIFRCPVD